MLEFLSRPWPWYVSGPLLGLMVPLLLLLGNKSFGISSSLQHICAIVVPRSKAEYFRYNWKESLWNLVLIGGTITGALLAVLFLDGDAAPDLSAEAREMFMRWGMPLVTRLQPDILFRPESVLSLRVLLSLVLGGFLVGFGTRYGNGCTSGHAIMGLSLLNGGSLAATLSFFAGGILVSNLLVPVIMGL